MEEEIFGFQDDLSPINKQKNEDSLSGDLMDLSTVPTMNDDLYKQKVHRKVDKTHTYSYIKSQVLLKSINFQKRFSKQEEFTKILDDFLNENKHNINTIEKDRNNKSKLIQNLISKFKEEVSNNLSRNALITSKRIKKKKSKTLKETHENIENSSICKSLVNCKSFMYKGECLLGKDCPYRHITINNKMLVTYEYLLKKRVKLFKKELCKPENVLAEMLPLLNKIISHDNMNIPRLKIFKDICSSS